MINNFLRQYVDVKAIGPVLPSTDPAGLEARIASLELACSALWELLKAKQGYMDEELVKLVEEVDARDGAADGRITPSPEEMCPRCGRKLLTKQRHHCAWCGVELPRRPF